jgi:homoserine kinase
MRARVPASSANLGPGFDALGLALATYVEVSVQPAARLEIISEGFGSDLPRDASHLAARVATEVAGDDGLRIEVLSDIPVGRGLGSSAALAVAAAAAAGAGSAEVAFAYGVRIDGHPENAAACAFGGLVVATFVGEAPVWRRLSLDPALRFVAVIPTRPLLTVEARAVLPASVPLADAVFNLGRLGLLIPGLADHRLLVAGAGDDRLHQAPRSILFPEAPALLDGLREAGALTSFWSGAGPTLLAVCHCDAAEALAREAEGLLQSQGVPGEVRVLDADRVGITLSEA